MNRTTKTTLLTDDTHKRLKGAQSILEEEYGIEMTIVDILAYIVPEPKQSTKIILDKIFEKKERIFNMPIVEGTVNSENIVKIPV